MKIVIVGDGKIGSTLAEQLSREGHEITIIDRSGEPLQQTSEDLDILCIEGNGATYATQMEAGVDAADLLIAVTMSDELNLLCCLVAKKSARGTPSPASETPNTAASCR
ncbi:MAG: NAD-binding protein [Oscillospiraceae bacterium]